ncbi:hypothetical protein BH18GEM1_BH18GEM1_20700 [soil metagenome]
MQRFRIVLLGLLVLALAAPAGLLAQGRGKDNGKGHGKKNHQHHESNIDHARLDRTVVLGRDGRGTVVILEDGPGRDRDRRVRNRDDDDRDRDRDRNRDRDNDDRLVLRDRNGRVIVIHDDAIDERFRHRGGNGPPFCRSGAGHPVHGRRWCLEKGWGLGNPGDIFFGDGEIFFWDDGDLVIVRDSRFRDRRVDDRRVVYRGQREPDLWERALATVLFWMD